MREAGHCTIEDIDSFDTYFNASVYIKQIQTLAFGNFTHIDLTYIDMVGDQYSRVVPEKYWNLVGKIYAKRLSLSADGISCFIRSSKELASCNIEA